MCQRIQCPDCKKPSYSGCGRHVEQVLGDVPVAERCRCREERQTDKKGEKSFFARLFERG